MKNKMLAVLIIVALIFTALPFNAIEASAATSYTTKASVEKRIKTLNSEISKLNKTYKAQKSKQKQQEKGTEPIYGSVECSNPFIVKQSFEFNTYYWVINPSKLNNSFLLASGRAKPTGKYKNWNGITCKVVKAVRVSKAADKTKKKINAKKAELKKLKKALTDTPKIKDKIAELRIGDTYKISASMKNKTGKYNKITWSSSNSSICTVKNGKLTGIAEGTCTIKAKASVSKKTDSFKIKIVENNGEPIQYGDHKIILSETNMVFNIPGVETIYIETGKDLEEISFKICDENGNETELGIGAEFHEYWDGDTLGLDIWPDEDNQQAGQYKILIYETDFPSNCKTIYITVNEDAYFSG